MSDNLEHLRNFIVSLESKAIRYCTDEYGDREIRDYAVDAYSLISLIGEEMAALQSRQGAESVKQEEPERDNAFEAGRIAGLEEAALVAESSFHMEEFAPGCDVIISNDRDTIAEAIRAIKEK